MGRLFLESLSGPKIFKCKCCKVDSASHQDIVSKDFRGRLGRAYLFRNLEQPKNVISQADYMLYVTYTAAPAAKSSAGNTKLAYALSTAPLELGVSSATTSLSLGTGYGMQEKAYEVTEKYKEGLYILERERMVKEGW